MSEKNCFGKCHPVVQMIYWLVILLTTVFLMHPVFLGVSFLGAFLLRIRQKGIKKVLWVYVCKTVPFFLLIACINPAFNHYGVTELFRLKTGPVTLEAIVYGLVLAFVLYISVLWFSSFHEIMTTDRFVYLFGKLSPDISLVLSMAMRFVPRFTKQLKKIRMGQQCIGRDMEGQSILKKVCMGIREISMLLTWGLESGIDTADSMRARGYGTVKRTAYSVFSWTKQDKKILLILFICYGIVLLGISQGYAYALYDPIIQIAGVPLTAKSLLCYLAWAVCCLLPVGADWI